MDKSEHAILVATAAHYGQYDKGGRPRLAHVLHVGNQFEDETHKIVGYLHDTLEDSPLFRYVGLAEVFGDDVGFAVMAITRSNGEAYFDYIKRCRLNPIARAVKIADIKHSMDRSRWPEMPDSYYQREVKALAMLEAPAAPTKEET